MPLSLVKPRPGKTPYYGVRGHYLGIAVDRSTKAVEERTARKILKRWKSDIERGVYRDPRTVRTVATTPRTFLAAAVAYMQAGGERKHLSPIIEMTGDDALRDLPLEAIDQMAIDRTAAALYPAATAATRNRQFYTPVAAVLHHAGIDKRFKRPKGWRGNKSTAWLRPAQAFALFAAADAIDGELGLFLRTLCYTGMRLSEALAIRLGQVDLAGETVYLPKTKNGEARPVFLPPILVAALAAHPRGLDRHAEARLFRYHAGGRLRALLKAALAAAGLSFPRRQCGFHLFCHTYGTWMHSFAGLDNFGLTRTERWKDPRSADRYLHTEPSAESRRAVLLPVENARTKPAARAKPLTKKA